MAIARLDRDKLRRLSEDRLEEARVLLENKLWTGAYYLIGLAVECALKAQLAQAVQKICGGRIGDTFSDRTSRAKPAPRNHCR